MTRYKIELAHKLSILNGWAFNPDKDTISSLSEKQAQEICYKINECWLIIDRRKKKP